MKCSTIFLLFIIFSSLLATFYASLKFSKFPLEDCASGDTDLLIATDAMSQSNCIDPEVQITFFSQVSSMFISSRKPSNARLRIYFASFSPTSSQTILYFDSSINSTQNKLDKAKLSCTKTKNRLQREISVPSFIDFVDNHFNDNYNEIDNSSKVAIIVITGPNPGAVEEIYRVQNERYLQTTIKLFVTMVNFDEESHTIVTITDTLHVSSYSELIHSHLIYMSVCRTCRPGWIAFQHQDSLNLISCYFVNIGEGCAEDWFEAASKCEKLGSKLASVETKAELDFVEIKLYETLVQRFDFSENVNIFIGLRREQTLTKSFRWLSGNPLVTSHWADANRTCRYIQECAMWTLKAFDVNVTINYTEEFQLPPLKEMYTNGWTPIGCSVAIGNAGLCEAVLQTVSVEEKVSLESTQERFNNTSKTIGNGEFIDYRGEIVSIPANAEDMEFYSSLKDAYYGFELFHCEIYEGHDRIISYSYVCDHVRHCRNGRDELICSFPSCDQSLEFECRSHQCVPLESRCDVYPDCFDNSDEEDCLECQQKRSCDGSCIPKHWASDNCTVCNDCYEYGSSLDEKTNINNDDACAFVCNRTACVFPLQVGDGVLDCIGPEGNLDEMLGQLERSNACHTASGEVMWAPRCVYVKDRYESILGCPDMSHLWNCPNFTCPEGYSKCPGSYCIALHLVKDGKPDCPLGEDEKDLTDYSCVGHFACSNSHVCIHLDLVCDGSPQCPFRDDELNCHVTCANGFLCISGTVSVTGYDATVPLKNLTFVDRRTRYLDLSGIDVSAAIIDQDVTHLEYLITVRLSNCKITTANGMFLSGTSKLKSVYSFDLSHNLLKKISKKSIFRYMSNLRILNLSYNKELAVIEEKAFLTYYKKSVLERLDLHNTAIVTLLSGVLQGLNSLKFLNLSNTLIVSLYKSSFPKDFKLQILDLRDTAVLGYNTYSFNGLSIKGHLYTDTFGLCCPQIRGTGISEQNCHAPEDTISSCSHLVRELVQRVLLWVMGIVAVLGNVTVILYRLVWDRSVLRKAYVIFVTSLGISDLIMGVYLLIIACADLYYKNVYVLNGKIWKASVMCQVAGFLSTLSSETTAFFTLLVTLDRYLVMKFPFGQWNLSNRSMYTVSILAWVCGFIFAVIPILPTQTDWTVYSSNGMCLGLPLDTNKLAGWRYSVAVFVALNSAVFLVIVVGQFSIYRAISGNRAAASAVQGRNRHAQEIAVARQLSLVVLSNFLCWFPIGLMGLLAVTGHEIGKIAYTWSAVLVLPINSALNPLLYTVPAIHDKWKQFMSTHAKHRSKGDKKEYVKSIVNPNVWTAGS